MKKYLDILIFSLLFFLLFSFFSWKQDVQEKEGILFSVQKQTYKVPAGVVIELENFSPDTLVFNPCNDLSLRKSGSEIALPEILCQNNEILRSDTFTLDLSSEYSLFENPWQYIFEYETGEKKFIEQFEVKYRGTLGKIFVWMFYAPVYNLLVYLIDLFSNSLGWAIVSITVIIRIVLLFPQHKMMVSQRKMQAIQPKIKKLQEKYKWNQQQMWMELMKLYKTEKVNPMGSCGLLLIQMPILLVIYNIIMNITSEKNAFHLYNPLSSFQISSIDYSFFGMDLLQAGGVVWLILAITVGIIQYIQIRLSLLWNGSLKKTWVVLEKKKWDDSYNNFMPDPEMMNKFMLYGMPWMVAVFTYFFFAWLWLYWWMTTIFMIFQQLIINKISKKSS